jgi:hypothetical protein
MVVAQKQLAPDEREKLLDKCATPKKQTDLNKSKGLFPLPFEIWYVRMSHSYILTLPPRLTSEQTSI